LIATIPKSIGPKSEFDKGKYEALLEKHYGKVIEYSLNHNDVDILHDHPGHGLIGSRAFSKFEADLNMPVLVTLHGAFSKTHTERYNYWKKIASKNKNIYFNTLSKSQKSIFEENGFHILDFVYHGIPLEDFPYMNKKSNFLFSMGRIIPKKGQHLAVDISRKTGMPLILGGEINPAYHSYWKESIEPYLDFSISQIPVEEQDNFKNNLADKLRDGEDIVNEGKIIFVGGLNDIQKTAFYGRAKAFLMPIQWHEPFGLTMVESMACGTPVIAINFGSVSEVIKDKETGFILEDTEDKKESLEAIVRAVNNIEKINPERCRKHIEENFSIEREVKNYLKLYNKILGCS